MATAKPPNSVVPVQTAVVELKVREIIAKALEIDVDDVGPSASLLEELGAESLDLVDIAFMLERGFNISFPRTDIIERSIEYFGEDAFVVDGVVTDFGLDLLRKGMPEIDPDRFQPGIRDVDVARMINVETFVRIVTRLLEKKAQFPRTCPACGATIEESDIMPEFVCPQCGETTPLPSGDAILLEDLVALAKETGKETGSASNCERV